MSNHALVFVYGTLLKGEGNHPLLLDSKCMYSDAYIKGGKLLHLGGFPGLVEGEHDVKGEVYMVDGDVLESLDRLEGYRPDAPKNTNFYNRTITPVFNAVGQKVCEAYIYMFNLSPERRKYHVIINGDWRNPRMEYDANATV